MKPRLLTRQVGPYSMNTYVLIDDETQNSVIVDPGGDVDEILKMTSGTQVRVILVTHGHFDHVLVLEEIKATTQAPVYLHPAEAEKFNLQFDYPLGGNQRIPVGNIHVRVVHAPGHTPGQCCFDLGDERIIVGDTIFVGGPGKTESPGNFEQTMLTMKEIVFSWSDTTQFYPGHGPSGKIGVERPKFEAFLARGWTVDTFGDITW